MKELKFDLNKREIEVLNNILLKSICVFILATLFSCSNDLEKIQEISFLDHDTYPVETIKDGKIIYSDSAIVRVILQSGKIDRFIGDDSYLDFSDGVEAQFFNIYGEEESRLSADHVVIDEVNKIMEAKKDVKVYNISGDLLETEHLIWNEKTEKIYTEEFVKITTKDEVIYGEGLESNQYFSQYTIKKIKGTITLKN